MSALVKKVILFAALAAAACGGPARRSASDTASQQAVVDMHNAENSLDYRGTYEGTLPAADCPGIVTTITLGADGRYECTKEYIECDASFEERGAYEVDGNMLTLTPADGDGVSYYKVEENRLRRLDADRRPVTGELADNYILQKKR